MAIYNMGTNTNGQHGCTTGLSKDTTSYLGKRKRNDNDDESDSTPEMDDYSSFASESEAQTPVQSFCESYEAHMAELTTLEAELRKKYANYTRTIAQVKAEIKAIQRSEPPLGYCRHPATGRQWKRQMIDSDRKRPQKQWEQWCNLPKHLRIPAEDGYESGDSDIDDVNEFLEKKKARQARKIIHLQEELEELLWLQNNPSDYSR